MLLHELCIGISQSRKPCHHKSCVLPCCEQARFRWVTATIQTLIFTLFGPQLQFQSTTLGFTTLSTVLQSYRRPWKGDNERCRVRFLDTRKSLITFCICLNFSSQDGILATMLFQNYMPTENVLRKLKDIWQCCQGEQLLHFQF